MKKFFYLLGIILFFINAGFAQKEVSKPIIIKANYFGVSPPLRDMYQDPNKKADMSWKEGYVKNNLTPKGVQYPDTDSPFATDPNVQTWNGQIVADTTQQNFDGVAGDGSLVPPDTYGDVGPNHYFHVVNLKYAIYNKSGVKILGPFWNSQIFNGLPHNSNDGDAVVLYDEQADRWIFSQFSLPNSNGPYYQNVAVSQTSDPTGSWYLYQFTFSDFIDYPKLSVWPDAYYMSTNRFSPGAGSYKGIGAIAMDRTKMIAGDPSATMIMFTLPPTNLAVFILPSDCDGPFPPMGTPNYFTFHNDGPDQLVIREFHVDWNTPANSTFSQVTTLPVNAFTGAIPNGIPQKGTSIRLSTMSSQLMYRLQFRKFSDHWSMVSCATVNVGSDVAGIRWYELRKTGSNPWTIYQQGTYSPDNNCRWMGSIAMDSSGNMALGYSISSSNMYPSIRFTGRMNGDNLGQMTIAESNIINGGGSQTNSWSGNPSRWGDYSSMTVDPSQTAKFWYTQEYYAYTSGANWKTRVGSFSFADLLSVDANSNPSTICVGGSSQLNVNVSGGTGTYAYSWTSIPAGFTSSIQNPVVSPLVDTKYIATINDGTQTKRDTTMVTVLPLPTAFAGNDTTYCIWVPAFPLAGTSANAGQVKWTTTGDGHFNMDTTNFVVYFVGPNDHSNGSVSFTFTAYPLASCPDSVSDEITVFFDACTGIPAPVSKEFSLKISPNPVQDAFNLLVNGYNNQEITISVSDLPGKTIFREKVRVTGDKYERKIDVTSYPRGIYFVKVQSESLIKTEKIVVN